MRVKVSGPIFVNFCWAGKSCLCLLKIFLAGKSCLCLSPCKIRAKVMAQCIKGPARYFIKKGDAKWDQLKTGFLVGFGTKKFGNPNFYRIFWLFCGFALRAWMVGPTGFEPATSTTPRWRATGLRHGPTIVIIMCTREDSNPQPLDP